MCLPLTLLPRTMFCHCISGKVSYELRSVRRFELIQIFKALMWRRFLCLTTRKKLESGGEKNGEGATFLLSPTAISH